MTDYRPACDNFREEVERVVDYFRREFSLTYSEAVGVLEMVKFDLLQESTDDNQETTGA